MCGVSDCVVMLTERISSPHIWSPVGGQASKTPKKYQPVSFSPSSLVQSIKSRDATSQEDKHAHKHTHKHTNERTEEVDKSKKNYHNDESFDGLSSIVLDDTDSNISEDYQAMLTTETLPVSEVNTNSPHEPQGSWFSYLTVKSQKEDLKVSNEVPYYPYIEISSSVRKRKDDGIDRQSSHASKQLQQHQPVEKEKKILKKQITSNEQVNKCSMEQNFSSLRSNASDAKYKMEVYKNQPLKIDEYEPGFKSSIFQTHTKGHTNSGLRWYESDADIDYRTDPYNEYFVDSGYLSSTGITEGTERRRKQDIVDLIRQTSLEHVLAGERESKLKKERLENESRRHHDTFMPKEKEFLSDRYDQLPSVVRNSNTRVKGRARVLFNFKPQHENELSLKKGEVVQLLRRVDANWYKGEFDGRVGVFPSNYVDVIVSLEEAKRLADDKAGRAIAVYDFIGRNPLELSLKKGDELLLIRRIDSDWCEGRLRGKQGIFPSSYVDIIRPPSRPITPAADELSQASRSSSLFSLGPDLPSPWNSDAYESEFEREYLLSRPENLNRSNNNTISRYNTISRTSDNFLTTKSSRSNREPSYFSPTKNFTNPSKRPHIGDDHSTGRDFKGTINLSSRKIEKSSDGKEGFDDRLFRGLNNKRHEVVNGKKMRIIERCRALYDYEPQNDDELKLREGDLMSIVEKCDDGWFIGLSESTRRFGTFPGNYVLIVR